MFFSPCNRWVHCNKLVKSLEHYGPYYFTTEKKEKKRTKSFNGVLPKKLLDLEFFSKKKRFLIKNRLMNANSARNMRDTILKDFKKEQRPQR